MLKIVARHQGQLDAANRVTRTIVICPRCGLLADICRLGDDRGSSGPDSCLGCGSSLAGISASNGGLRRAWILGFVSVEALLLAARLSAAVAVAVLLDTSTPFAKIEAFNGGRETSILPAGSHQFRTRPPSVEAAVLVIKIRDMRSTPLPNLVLALTRRDRSSSA